MGSWGWGVKVETVKRFEEIKDILVYITFAMNDVGSLELEENVTELSRSRLNILLKRLVEAGYLHSNGKKNARAYTATEKTKQLFGAQA
jgi:predicted transcriptional regulator